MGRDEPLRRRIDFRRVYDEGGAHREPDVVLVLLRNDRRRPRFAVVASRKVGGAVRRNRSKRLLREAHRRLRPADGFQGFDIVLIARAGTPLRSSREIAAQLTKVYRRAGLLDAENPAGTGEPTDS